MQDREMVAAIVAGDPGGLAAAYTTYAASLYAYCCGMLGEPADASDAVQDTFIIAAARLGKLRDPDRLRPWLYAVARNECTRRLRTRSASAALGDAGEVPDDTVDLGTITEQAELRELVRAALAGLNPGEREVIELGLRHEFHGAGLADALGVPRNQAHALASRARAQLEAALGALLVARLGRRQCAELAGLLEGWDGELTVLLRKRLNRHIERCAACGGLKRRELSPVTLLGLLPVAVLPAGLRQQVLHLVASASPAAVARRGDVLARASALRDSGFPVQLSPPARVPRPGRLAVRAGAVGAACAGLAVLAVLLNHGPAPAGPSAVGPGPAGTGPPAGRLPRPGASQPGAVSAPVLTGPVVAVAPGIPPRVVVPTAAGSAPAGAASGSPAPSALVTVSPGASAGVAGTLSVSPLTLRLNLDLTATFTLTATGGPVSGYRITVPAILSATPSSGSLPAGASVTVRVQVALGSSLLSPVTLTVNPGGITVVISPH